MTRLKAVFVVSAGIIPGEPIKDHAREWLYTDEDFDADQALPPMPEGYKLDWDGPLDQPHMSRFTRMQIESRRHAESITHPSYLNWVRHEWMWL